MNILVVDDEVNILTLFSAVLSKAGYKAIPARNGAEALDKYYEGNIDMIICDEMMPVMTGNELVKEIRKENQNIPIIMVTAKGSIQDKGTSYSSGVDDYMVKPIDCDELVMRIMALSRRAKINAEEKIRIGNVVLDRNLNTVSDGTKCVSLTKTEFAILFKLLSYPEKAFTKWQLFNEFWGVCSDTDDDIVKTFISKIRKQISVFPQIEIKTIMGVGYQGVKHEEK